MFRKTRIVCTLGPATDDLDLLKAIIRSGMNVARLNFSHGSHEEHANRIKLLRQAEKETGADIAVMLDTAGPEIRTGNVKDGLITLTNRQKFTLTTSQIEGDQDRVSVSYDKLPSLVRVGQRIMLDDGLIDLDVVSVTGDNILCEVINGGPLTNRRGVNIPDALLPFPALTEKDRDDLRFGVEQDVHIIAASFVRNADDVRSIRDWLREIGGKQLIISKIESMQGVKNLDEIIELSDGIMVARGDLGVEYPVEELPILQKEMIRLCNRVGKPVITATQMLDSMIKNPRPTRAEASDVANAILDGTDAIMLSGETAAGKHPVETVATMANIAEHTDSSLLWLQQHDSRFNAEATTDFVSDSVARAACLLAEKLDAKAILTSTQSGFTARHISRFRPMAQIIATVPNEMVRKQLLLSWGVTPIKVPMLDSTDEVMDAALSASVERGLIADGDTVVITAGVPSGKSGNTNLIKVHLVGDSVR